VCAQLHDLAALPFEQGAVWGPRPFWDLLPLPTVELEFLGVLAKLFQLPDTRISMLGGEGKNALPILGAFAKLRKTTINFFMSVRLSAWNNSAPTGRIFMKFYTSVFL
jgi:hypothetical protein